MPDYSKKKRSYKKKHYKKSKSTKNIDKEVNKQLKKHGIVKTPQIKHHIMYVNSTTAVTTTINGTQPLVLTNPCPTPSAISVSLLPSVQGVQYENLFGGTILGQEIQLKYLHIRGLFYYNAPASGVLTGRIRIIVVEDLQPSANASTLVSGNTILQLYSSTNAYDRLVLWDNTFDSIIQVTPKKTFRILMDWQTEICNNSFQHNSVTIDKVIRLKDLSVTYNEPFGGGAMTPQNRDIQMFVFGFGAGTYLDIVQLYTDVGFTDAV